MREPRPRPPEPIRRVLRGLFPGARGAEILEELGREYGTLRERHSGALAWGWYLAQLLRPATWRLAWALHRTRRVERSAGAGPVHDIRGAGWLSGLSLDLKLAWRRLIKSPGMTVVGVLGIALGTGVGVGFFVVLSSVVHPELPLDEGERIVALENWDVEANEAARRSLHDFVIWREEMRSVERIAAAAVGLRPLVTGDGPPRFVRWAAMTAAGFDVARVPPLLGRHLVAEDEREGATPVVVLGYDLWQAQFEGDPGATGRSILVGGSAHTVVGVMPPGFAFPRNEELWTALQASPLRHERGVGPELVVFGRLAPGVTLQQAQAELTSLGRRAAAAFPETNAQLRPQVLPYPLAFGDGRGVTLWEIARVQLVVILILVAIAANLAVLVYARTALRQGEIAVRTALGASRRRIVGQLFLEALLLSLLGAGLGMAAAHVAVHRLWLFLEGMDGIPFWIDFGVDPASTAYALVLVLLAAVIVGVVPGLQSTGRRLDAHLRRMGAGASVRLGWLWTAMIVAQVAVVVTVLPTALHMGVEVITPWAVRPTFPAHEVLTADVAPAITIRPGMDAEQYRRESATRFARVLPELERQLEAEPAVVGATLGPGSPPPGGRVEVEGTPESPRSGGHRVRVTFVAPDYFDVLGVRVVAGGPLRASDVGSDVGEPGGNVVVTEAFVRRVLDGEAAVGRRIRFVPPGGPDPHQEPHPWMEIVGVVEDLHASAIDADWAPPAVYHPVSPGLDLTATILVRVRDGDPAAFAPRFRQITAALDPDLRVGSVGNLARTGNARLLAMMVAAMVLALGSVLLLSAAGIHALTSLAVTRRRKEIGIRRALGSHSGRLLANVFSRATWQLGLGGLLGTLAGGALLVGGGRTGQEAVTFLGAVVVLMLAAGLVAAVGPAMRGLRIQPSEALKEE